MTKHGIITGAGRKEGVILLGAPWTSLTDICAYGVDEGYTHLWVLSSTGIIPTREWVEALRGQWDLKACTWQYKNAPADAPNLLRSLYTYRLRSNPENAGKSFEGINVMFCGEQAAWGWAKRPDLTAASALRMIDFLQDALGVPVTGSPGNTGYTYLTHVEAKHKNWFARPTIDSDDMDFAMVPWEKAVKTIQFARQPTAEELACTHLVKIDKNADFPRGACDDKQGVGNFYPLRGVKARVLWDDPEWDMKTPGIWNLEMTHQPDFMKQFPSIKSGWHTTAMVRAARENGYRFEIEQAWLFSEGAYILKKTMNTLWKIRAELPDDDPRREALKQIMNDLCGLFHHSDMGNSPKNRPDIYAGITGSSYAIMLHNMVKFADTLGLFPLISHVDCIVYAINRPLADLFPDNRTAMGGYKHEWDIPMTDEVRGILTSGRGSAVLLQQLNAIAARQAEEAEAERLRVADDYTFYLSDNEDDEEEGDDGWDEDYFIPEEAWEAIEEDDAV